MMYNLKIAIRNLQRNGLYSWISMTGLATGIAAAALVLLWVEYQVNFNKNIPKHKYLYRIGQHQKYGDETHTFFASPGPLFETLNNEFPDVKCNARCSDRNRQFLKEGDLTPMSMYGMYADSCIFGMLSMDFVEGAAHKAFESLQSIVISEKMAAALFGDRSPVGETLKDEEGTTYAVTGVFKDFRKGNNFSSCEWMIPFPLWEKICDERGYTRVASWGNNWHSSYVELHPGVDVARLNEKLSGLAVAKTNGDVTNKYFVYPLDRMRLYGEFRDGLETGGGYIRIVRMFFWIGCIILLIACINFMNLSTARSEKRALEVGVRKTFGSRRSRLVQQFMSEAGAVTCIALLVAVALIYYCLPLFNRLFSYELSFDFTNLYHYGGLLAIGVLCTLLAGSYPAFYLSSFAPLTVLKKLKKPGGSAAWIRKGLVVLQFSVSFVLICATLVIFLQIRHAQQRPLGFVKENVMLFPVNTDIAQRTEVVRQELLHAGIIDNVGFSNSNIMQIWNNGGGFQWQGKAPETNPLISMLRVTPGLLETVGIKIAEGETFTEKWTEGTRPKIIINRTLANMMGEAGHTGTLTGQGDDVQDYSEISGIVEDFVFNNIYGEKPQPLIIYNSERSISYLFVKLSAGADVMEVQTKVKSILQTFSPNTSFDAMFMDDTFNRMFEGERLIGRLAGLFAALAVLISCLGLLGLSAFAAEQRTKEIGIRKVLGASVADILLLLGKNFMLLILIAVGIGLPVAWYVSAEWLQGYDYRISLGWGVFAATALLISLIALLTVSAQSLRAATANPIKAIKTE